MQVYSRGTKLSTNIFVLTLGLYSWKWIFYIAVYLLMSWGREIYFTSYNKGGLINEVIKYTLACL